MVPARFGRTQAAPPPFLPKSPSGCPTLLESPQPVLQGRKKTAAGGENRARASLPCGASNTCVMRLVGRGCFHAGRGKTCFCGNLFALRRLFLCGQRKNRTPCGGPTFFGGKSARMSAERAASEVGRIREDGWEVSGKPRRRAAECNCDSTEGCAGDSPEKAKSGVGRSFPQPVLSPGRERRRFGRMNGVSPGGGAVPRRRE